MIKPDPPKMINFKEINKSRSSIYNPLLFLQDLKKEVEKIVPLDLLWRGKLSDRKFSRLLGKGQYYIEDLKRQIRKNPNYQITLDILKEYKINLKKHIGNLCVKVLGCIEKYNDSNKLRKKSDVILKYHPKIKLDYFKEIDTKEKAYWLGFIYADGYIYKSNIYSMRFGIEISKKDEILINRFAKAIGFNLKYKHYRKSKENYESIYIRFVNNKIISSLKKHGVFERKSKILEIPKLNSRSLYLAFLLGLFDGDGEQGSTKLISGSKILLEQIKNKFKIPYKIVRQKTSAYHLYLGSELFNEMMGNYRQSLERKRYRPLTKIEKINKIRAVIKKVDLNKKELQKLVWKMPLTKIGEKINVSKDAIRYWVKKWNINIPPRGYWRKNKNH